MNNTPIMMFMKNKSRADKSLPITLTSRSCVSKPVHVSLQTANHITIRWMIGLLRELDVKLSTPRA